MTTKTDNISISLFRVSGDSKYLDVIMDCPIDFYFAEFLLEVKYLDGGTMKSLFFDLSPALFKVDLESALAGNDTIAKKHWVIRVPLEALKITIPAIYTGSFKAEYLYSSSLDHPGYGLPIPYTETAGYSIDTESLLILDENDDPVEGVKGIKFDTCSGPKETLSDTAICSDVNFAYRCMLDDILKMGNPSGGDPCAVISDDAIRKYLILYGHLAAMAVLDLETAELYFKLIQNCFNKCGGASRPKEGCAPRPQFARTPSCGCGK